MSTNTRGQKGESLVKKNLSKIKEYHHLLNDITFVNEKSEMTHQVDHILIHPHGVFVIETKNYYGTIICNTGGKTVEENEETIDIIFHNRLVDKGSYIVKEFFEPCEE